MEAGARWMLNDVAGKPIRAWDSRGHNFTHRLRRAAPPADAVRSSARRRLRPAHAEPRHPGRAGSTTAKQHRRSAEAAQPARASSIPGILDQAGVGHQPKPTTSRATCCAARAACASDYNRQSLDCAAAADLAARRRDARGSTRARRLTTYTSRTRYDALNRPIQPIAPHSTGRASSTSSSRSTTRPTCWSGWTCGWNARRARGLLDPATTRRRRRRHQHRLRRQGPAPRASTTSNGASTTYAYDPLTFRLTHLLHRGATPPAFPDD